VTINGRKILALDYDDTLADNGHVDARTQAALTRFRDAGGVLILVTGRTLEQLRDVYGQLASFEIIVLENGCVLYRPGTDEVKLLGPGPPPSLLEFLRQYGVAPLHIGRVVVSTDVANTNKVKKAILASGAQLELATNRSSLMILPVGVDKTTGFNAALEEIGAEPTDVVAVGDAENDLPFLRLSGYSAAVANATDAVKASSDAVLSGERGKGVAELISALLGDG
jgi:hydroxymethylpyrimidine pyrophosphatase-like HAD family hydrolase